ncbi:MULTISPECIES: polysaccharide biosynthesis/export family protein [Flavobacteriaceae]|uniref:Polysaccharide export protein n=2 Tax=Flavobacteriaceae TaxID=49546 RepID=A0A4Y8AWU9_9FLAO|nr:MULTISPECIES: polysaccharide biosynthesis/export family protein [Flavobacteriaceae]TEW77016.1 polysaccharide export protein [Gramella jeungdoensis]
MKKNRFTLLKSLVFLVLLTACTSPKKMVYFQGAVPEEVQEVLVDYEPKIQPGDLITIHVSGIDPIAAATFNIYEGTGVSSPKKVPYLVNKEGTIHFPVLGAVKAKGLTTLELTTYLEANLEEFLVKPIVNIRLINFKISVMGDVKAPGAYTIDNERITIVEALVLAGDLTIQGKRKNVLLIREIDGKRTFIPIDLTNRALFNSPYYYLVQNDVLYVEPNKAKIKSSGVGTNAGIIISSISTLISLIAILTR